MNGLERLEKEAYFGANGVGLRKLDIKEVKDRLKHLEELVEALGGTLENIDLWIDDTIAVELENLSPIVAEDVLDAFAQTLRHAITEKARKVLNEL